MAHLGNESRTNVLQSKLPLAYRRNVPHDVLEPSQQHQEKISNLRDKLHYNPKTDFKKSMSTDIR
jgi:hypothetical protein